MGSEALSRITVCIINFLLAFVESTDPLDSKIVDNSVYCFSCLTQPLMYGQINQSALYVMLNKAGLHIPREVKQCKDTPLTERPNFRSADIAYCREKNVCMKLKGSIRISEKLTETFVLRNCWDRAWMKEKQPFEVMPKPTRVLGEWCVSGEGELGQFPFLPGANKSQICYCDRDLCNSANFIPSSSTFSCFSMILTSILLLLIEKT